MESSLLSVWLHGQGLVTVWLLAIYGLVYALARWLSSEEIPRLNLVRWLLLGHVVLGFAAARAYDPIDPGHQLTLLFAQLMAVAISVSLFNALVFGVLLRRQVSVPTVLRDVLGLLVLVIAALILANTHGFDLKGIGLTTSALTVVIGLAAQQTLGNLIGGLSIQMDKSVRVGDWIEIEGFNGLGTLRGRVSEIKWRSTTIETNNFESVVVPNSLLLQGRLVVLGRRGGQPAPLRRWIYFQVDHEHSSGELIALLEAALNHDPIQHVAAQPSPNVVVMGLEGPATRYAARYWLDDLAFDDATDSELRQRIAYALRRAGLQVSIPSQRVFLTEETQAREAEASAREQVSRLKAMQHLELFQGVTADERLDLARALRPVSFAKGEALTRQGDEAHWLYVLVRGSVSVVVNVPGGGTKEVARLEAGSYFGEMGLMTGEPRTATVLALSHVDCYRLDKDAFHKLLTARPEIAEGVADVLAKRRVELEAVREALDLASQERRRRETASHLLSRIRAFFSHKG